ncbi:hypothetical protein H0A71_15565 [Alcaligenaceae bacterium]|nr:hypothetical protein [Alcaligenaceae bacterium]
MVTRIKKVPGVLIPDPIIKIPPFLPLAPDYTRNFFEKTRPGQAVVRADDLLALRFEANNLAIVPGSPPRIKKQDKGAATLIVHFPPQSIAEQAFFETTPGAPQAEKPSAARARISGESRLAFKVPDGFDVPYTLEGLLQAISTLEPAVVSTALPPQAQRASFNIRDLFDTRVDTLTAQQRTAVIGFAFRSLRIAAVQNDVATLRMRQISVDTNVVQAGRPGLSGIEIMPDMVEISDALRKALERLNKQPAAPTAKQTAIEFPWRLILSPHANERWQHADTPVTSPATQRTELWHSRLYAMDAAGKPVLPPTPDPQRTVRAIWATSGEGSSTTKPLTKTFPGSDELPASSTSPFRMAMTDRDRYQIVHETSNFSLSSFQPTPVATNLLMLSSQGAWLDSRGYWDAPGLDLEEWVHNASMGRDHYVRIVNKGVLFPFGHAVVEITVTERKFHNGALKDGKLVIEQEPGNVAALRQRKFLVVRQPLRTFADPTLTTKDKSVKLHLQMPLTSVRLLTHTTPNLDPEAYISGAGESYWPAVNSKPFEFECVATDLDGRQLRFSLPMIFMKNSAASPHSTRGSVSTPNFDLAEIYATKVAESWRQASNYSRRRANTRQQRVTLARSAKAGDTTLQMNEIEFDALVEKDNQQLRTYSNDLTQPIFYPKIASAIVRIPALAQLTGSAKTNSVLWNAYYLKNDFSAENKGQVFLDVQDEAGMAALDFSVQGDRSGGFVQPNLKPSAISRLTGPVSGNVQNFIDGKMDGMDAFPSSLSELPLPYLFGCIPLGAIIESVTNLADTPDRVPKFVSEAATQAESFINDLGRLYGLASGLGDQAGNIAGSAIKAIGHTVEDIIAQGKNYAAALVADAQSAVQQVQTALNDVEVAVKALEGANMGAPPALNNINDAANAARSAISQLRTAANTKVNGVSLPAGLRQNLLQLCNVADIVLDDVLGLALLFTQGKVLYAALDDIVGNPQVFGDLLEHPDELAGKLQALQTALTPMRATIAASHLLDGAPRKVLLDAIDATLQMLEGADALLNLLQMLTGDELTIRFDWNPQIKSWSLVPGAAPLFRVNDIHGFLVAVEAKVKKNGQSAPKLSVVCSLKNFDLVLIAPASFIELNFEKIEFRIDTGAKMDVDVLLNDIKFVGPLSFVETLRDLIPLDGFSDPPHLDITPQGIDAGFDIALPSIGVGIFNLSNLSLGAGFTVPFIGQPLSVRFNFCTREQPFNLSVCMFGGGGFFGITLDPSGIQLLEAAFEFGASISINLGVASGGVHVMAGVYFRMEQDACSLSGYFRLGGSVDVLGLITASIELYLELHYEFETGKAVGRAELTIEIEVFIFSGSVTVSCERKFAGSNGDPTFRDLMGLNPTLALQDELAQIDSYSDYPWREYAEAFA